MLKIPSISRLALIGLSVAVAVLILDQATKVFFHYVVDLPSIDGGIPVLPIFSFTHVWNEGVSFGLFKAETAWGRWLLALFALGVSGFIGKWLWSSDRLWTTLGLGMILGGALGNVIDRVIFGKVFDFLDFSGLGFPWVFNIADAGVSVGVAVLVLDMFFDKGHEQSQRVNIRSGGH